MSLSDELVETIDDLTRAVDTRPEVPDAIKRIADRLRQLRNDIISGLAALEVDGEDE